MDDCHRQANPPEQSVATHGLLVAQSTLDRFLEGGSDSITVADREGTSTRQTIESPGLSPSTVATDSGTVVFSESEAGEALNALDTKDSGIRLPDIPRRAVGHNSGLSRGRRLDLILKYQRMHGPIDRSMNGTRGPWDSATESRAVRMLSSHREAVRAAGRLRFSVRSSDGSKTYEVIADLDGWTCTCPDWSDRKAPCKHILETVLWLDPNRVPIREGSAGPIKPTYTQADWGAYDRGQQLEHQEFDRYLWDLLGGLPEKPWTSGKRGRPVIPLKTQALMSVRKVHLNQSTRRAKGLLEALNQDGKGILPRVPNYSVPSRFFNRPQATGILIELIERSALVLKEIEDAGTVAIDSSGFSTSTMGSYFTEKYEPERRHRFVKAHLAVGVKTHIVLAVTVTDEHGGDCPEFIPLLRRVAELGHTPARVAADKAYLSRENLSAADSLGIDPFIPFKLNSRGLAKGSPMWNRKHHEFQIKRDEFEAAYHARSNVETAFSAIKRKLGEPLLSKTSFARLNELLAKILSYNIGIVISQAELHGLEPKPTDFIPRMATAGNPGESAA
jgi:transposase